MWGTRNVLKGPPATSARYFADPTDSCGVVEQRLELGVRRRGKTDDAEKFRSTGALAVIVGSAGDRETQLLRKRRISRLRGFIVRAVIRLDRRQPRVAKPGDQLVAAERARVRERGHAPGANDQPHHVRGGGAGVRYVGGRVFAKEAIKRIRHRARVSSGNQALGNLRP